ncbi:MAG: hypothetical protein H6R23_1611, partial [Proteobacteria bacterium]|nr:hypothetical protein [Pseudomonadota bacterium]
MHHDEPAPALTGAGAEGQSTPAPDATGFFELETELAVLEGGCETLAA